MANKTNLTVRNKYIDIDLEDCVLPVYLSKHFYKILEKNTIPNMVFKGALWEPKTIIANALAKKLGADLLALQFNQEPRSKQLKRGDRTLTVLRLLLKKYRDAGEKKVFIIEDLKLFPTRRYDELFELIDHDDFHHFILYDQDKSVAPNIKYYPQISFDFKIDHSQTEEDAYWDQCQKLMKKYHKPMNLSELKMIIKTTYFFWISLFGRDTLKTLRKELEMVPLNPEKKVIQLKPVKRPVRLYPVKKPAKV